MKLFALALGALSLARVTLGQGSTTLVGTRTQNMVSGEQPDPTTTKPPDVPYTTVTNCWSTTGTSACKTETHVCPFDSTTTLQTWMSKGCNWSDMTLTPQPTLSCSTTFLSYMACLPTGSMPPFPSMPNRSQRLVAKHAQAVPTITEGPAFLTSSTPQAPVPTWTSNDGRSQRLVARHTTTDLGGRSQRWVAREAQVLSTMDLGGPRNRYIKRVTEAVPTPPAETEIPENISTESEMGIPCGEVSPCPNSTTLLGPDPEITIAVPSPIMHCPSGFFGPACGPFVPDGPKPTTLETVAKG